MPKAILLKNGFVFSERENKILLQSRNEEQIWVATFLNGVVMVEIRKEDVFDFYVKENRKDLPCSTYSLQSSSPVSSQPATTFPTANTPTTPPHALVFLQESLASLEVQVGSIRKFLAATCQQ